MPPLAPLLQTPILPILYQGIVYRADLRCVPRIYHKYWHTIFPGLTYLLASGFKLTSHTKIKLDRKNRRAIFHLSLEKEVEIYRAEDIVKPVDVNENSVAILYGAFAIILETDLARTTLGYSYRKEGIQRRNGSSDKEGL